MIHHYLTGHWPMSENLVIPGSQIGLLKPSDVGFTTKDGNDDYVVVFYTRFQPVQNTYEALMPFACQPDVSLMEGTRIKQYIDQEILFGKDHGVFFRCTLEESEKLAYIYQNQPKMIVIQNKGPVATTNALSADLIRQARNGDMTHQSGDGMIGMEIEMALKEDYPDYVVPMTYFDEFKELIFNDTPPKSTIDDFVMNYKILMPSRPEGYPD